MKNKHLGVSLIETMAVLAIAAVLASLAAPSFKDTVERSRLKSAVEQHMSQLYLAKSESIKQNKRVFYSMRSGAQQCYGFRVDSPCDCLQTDSGAADMCTLARADVPKSSAALASTFTTTGTEAFEPVRATVTAAGQLTWSSPSGYTLRTTLSSIGRISVCSPAGANNVSGYPSC